MHSSYYAQVQEGMDVLDRDGQKIGKAGETLGDYFNVDAGFLGTTEYYVPFSAITDVTDNNVFLNVRKDEVGNMGWDQRPEMSATTGQRTGDSKRFADEERTIQLREEELQARKTPVET